MSTTSSTPLGWVAGLERLWPWMLRLSWALVAVAIAFSLAPALKEVSAPVRIVSLLMAWTLWGFGLLATFVPHPIGLVGLRCTVPLLLAGPAWAMQSDRTGGVIRSIGLVIGLLVSLVVMHNETGHFCVNGPAYPNERRFLLRPSVPVLTIAAPLSAILVSASVVAGPLFLAAKHWLLGALSVLVGAGFVFVLARSLYGLARRFIVFVPAGVVLHDYAALREPVLFRRQVVETIHAAAADTDSLDLTIGASGLAIEFLLREKIELARLVGPRDRVGESGATARFLAVPTLPGRLLTEAASRRYSTT